VKDDSEVTSVRIEVQGAAAAEADRYAGELEAALQGHSPRVKITRTSDRHDTMDFGATLVLVLGSATVIEIAKGIRAYLQKRPEATLKIGGLTFKGASKDAAAIADALLKR